MSKQLQLFPDDRPGYRKNPKTEATEYPKRGKVFVMWIPDDQVWKNAA